MGYRELADALRNRIQDGTYRAESTLPRQEDLARDFAVNINTVRQAVRLLEAEGLVTAVRRRGTVVRSRPRMKRLGVERYAKSKWKFGGLVAFAADREASGRPWAPSDQTNKTRLTAADAEVAEAFGLSEGDLVYERARLVKDAGTPTHALTSYYRPDDVANTPLVDPAPGPAGRGGGFAVLTVQGLEPDTIAETLHSRMPTPGEIEVLEIPPGEPVVVLHRSTFTASGRLVEFARGVHRASHFSWTYKFQIPD
ncbi:GntR family transcriptional regulator [Actinoplanes sp. TRM 88003]|uniref:GntR family transcriptional regulator n=1 Tax=Paractinoplanes aksuensis TaxID=2939490 RepID=A0ABT1DPQ1_9ACTN|nr:GntR family transcriptional regulator [Actinoplanes aksuensis]